MSLKWRQMHVLQMRCAYDVSNFLDPWSTLKINFDSKHILIMMTTKVMGFTAEEPSKIATIVNQQYW